MHLEVEQEVRNAVDQAMREIGQRFDFKGTDSSVELRERENEIEMFARNAEGEEGIDYAACSRQAGGDMDIGFSGAWLIASVESFDCDEIEILYGGQGDPVLMRPVNSAVEDIRVVMPRRFS